MLDFASCEGVEISSFREPASDDSITVLNRAFLVRGVSPRVVGFCFENAVQALLVEKFTAVISCHASNCRQGSTRFHLLDSLENVILVDVVDMLDNVASAHTVNHNEQAASMTASGDNSIHLEVSELLAIVCGQWSVLKLPTFGKRLRGMRGDPRFSSFARMIRRISVKNAHITGLYVIIEGSKTRNVTIWQSFDDILPRIIRRTPLDENIVSEDNRHRHCQLHLGSHVALTLVNRHLCLNGIIFGVDPFVPITNGLVHGTSCIFSSPSFGRNVVDFGKLS